MSISGLRFGYVAFKVSNVEQSLRWYADAFAQKGLTLRRQRVTGRS